MFPHEPAAITGLATDPDTKHAKWPADTRQRPVDGTPAKPRQLAQPYYGNTRGALNTGLLPRPTAPLPRVERPSSHCQHTVAQSRPRKYLPAHYDPPAKDAR
jgi:hypothetical protein